MTVSGKSSAPHIFSSATVPKITGALILSFLPVSLISCLNFGWPAVRLFSIAIISSASTEFIFSKLTGKKDGVFEGTSFLTAIFIASMLPVHLPMIWVAIGCVSAVLIGRVAFGGLAANPFHPAMVGIGFLMCICPGFFDTQELSFSFASSHFLDDFLASLPVWMTDFLRANEAGSLVNSSLAAVFASALILMAWKLIVIEIPLLYLAVLAIGEGFQTSHLFMGWHMLYPIYFFVAFFIITDLVTTPTTRQGQRLFAVVAALLCLFFRHMTSDLPAIVYSVLLANAVVPWIDEWFRPQNSRRHHPWAEVAEGLKSQVRTAKHL